MKSSVHPIWWPTLASLSPFLLPFFVQKTRAFHRIRREAAEENQQRIARASPLALPELSSFHVETVVEERAEPGYGKDSGVSYLLRTNLGKVLFDVGFGPDTATFERNFRRLQLSFDDLDGVLVSHLHLDHMGGARAQWANEIRVPEAFGLSGSLPCWVPAACSSRYFSVQPVSGPKQIAAGLGSTGPLATSCFFSGAEYEQAAIALLKDRGLVLVIGCGHPTFELILEMVRKLSPAPIYAIIGGLHLPVTASRVSKCGVALQRLFGTGKDIFDPISDRDLERTLKALQRANAQKVLLSAHDSCDHALQRIQGRLKADVEILQAGCTYCLV